MVYKRILKVFTLIFKGKQKIGFQIDGLEKCLFLNQFYVQRITGVQINEIEILTGSLIKPIFFKVGEKMASGKIYEEGTSQIVKSFHIQCEDTVENLREKHHSLIQNLKEIKSVFHFNRNNKDIIGFDIGEEKPVFVSASIITGLTNLDLSEVHILEGSFIAPEYFNMGDNIYEGMKREPEICRKEGVILKNLNLRLLGEIEEMHARFENSMPTPKVNHFDSDYYYNDSYDSRDWLSDAAGTNDPEVMRDVYWNLD